MAGDHFIVPNLRYGDIELSQWHIASAFRRRAAKALVPCAHAQYNSSVTDTSNSTGRSGSPGRLFHVRPDESGSLARNILCLTSWVQVPMDAHLRN